MIEDPTLFWYVVFSATILMYMSYKWSLKGFRNVNTKLTFLSLAAWGIYEIVRMVM